jgi:hypothetical protein
MTADILRDQEVSRIPHYRCEWNEEDSESCEPVLHYHFRGVVSRLPGLASIPRRFVRFSG